MIHISLEDVLPGMVVARSILGGSGNGIQLAAGFTLDEVIINRCRRSGLRSLWVHIEGEDVVPVGNVNDQLALQAQQVWKDNIDLLKEIGEVQDITLDNLTRFTSDAGRFKNIIATSQIKAVVDQIIRSILGQEAVMINLASMRTSDGYLHQHALDVTITATMIASRLKLSMGEIQEMALGCFLMDLGMLIVPESIHEKKTPLTAQESHLFREHPAVGFAILRANEGIPINTAHVAYQHHERLDGWGYPRGLKADDMVLQKVLHYAGGNIHRYAQIATAAELYISGISPRPGTVQPLSPVASMRNLILEAGNGLNTFVVNALISMIPVYPAGTRITVTKCATLTFIGCVGVVTKDNLQDKEKPQILLLFDKFKRKIKPVVLDLAVEKGLEINFVPL